MEQGQDISNILLGHAQVLYFPQCEYWYFVRVCACALS